MEILNFLAETVLMTYARTGSKSNFDSRLDMNTVKKNQEDGILDINILFPKAKIEFLFF